MPLVERYGLKVRGCGPPVLPTTVRMTWLDPPEFDVKPPPLPTVEHALMASRPARAPPTARTMRRFLDLIT
jgi:hypothetical protein